MNWRSHLSVILAAALACTLMFPLSALGANARSTGTGDAAADTANTAQHSSDKHAQSDGTRSNPPRISGDAVLNTGTGDATTALNDALTGAAEPDPSTLDDSAYVIDATEEDGEKSDTPTFYKTSYPEAYYLTNLGQVTSVKLQSPWQDCWAFAVAAAIESSILKAEYAAKNAGSADTRTNVKVKDPQLIDLETSVDVSERALAWFAHERQSETSGGNQEGEGFYRVSPSNPLTQLSEGNFEMIESQLLARQSLLSDATLPYQYNDYNANPGWWSFSNTGSSEDARMRDWSAADDLRTTEELGWRVSEVYKLASPTVLTYDSDYGDYKYTGYYAPGTRAIKGALMDVGAVAISVESDASLPSEVQAGRVDAAQPSEHFNYSTWSQYNAAEYIFDNHAVTIVGWNDNYPAENFGGTTSGNPPGNGAWLCKNNWGSDALYTQIGAPEDATHWGIVDVGGGASGFFWLSYFDHSIASPTAFSVEPVEMVEVVEKPKPVEKPAENTTNTASEADEDITLGAEIVNKEGVVIGTVGVTGKNAAAAAGETTAAGGEGSAGEAAADASGATADGSDAADAEASENKPPEMRPAENLYQYDFLGSAEYSSPIAYSTEVWVANAFTANETELLRTVSARTFDENEDVTIQVWRVPAALDLTKADADDVFEVAQLATEQTATFEQAGFYRVKLDTPIIVNEGEHFIVAERIEGIARDTSGAVYSATFLNLELAFAGAMKGVEQTTMANVVSNPGESFVAINGDWMSVADFDARYSAPQVQAGEDPSVAFGNALIKAYTTTTTMAGKGIHQETVELKM